MSGVEWSESVGTEHFFGNPFLLAISVTYNVMSFG